MLALSLSLDLDHPFPKKGSGPRSRRPGRHRPTWLFAAMPLGEADCIQMERASTWTGPAGSPDKPGNYYSGGRTGDPRTAVYLQATDAVFDDFVKRHFPDGLPPPPGYELPVPKEGDCCCCVDGNWDVKIDYQVADSANFKRPIPGNLDSVGSKFTITVNLMYRGAGDTVKSDCSVVWEEEWQTRNKKTDPLKVTRPRADEFAKPANKEKPTVKAWGDRQKKCGTREKVELIDMPHFLHSSQTTYKERIIKFYIRISSGEDCDCAVKDRYFELEQRLVVDDYIASKDDSHMNCMTTSFRLGPSGGTLCLSR